MKLAVLTASVAPWSPGVIEAMHAAGLDLNLVMFHPPGAAGYTSTIGQELVDRHRAIGSQLRAVHEIRGRGRGLGTYVRMVPELRRATASDDLILTLYGGGFGLAARFSGRPFAVYGSGSDILRVRPELRWLTRAVLNHAVLVPCNGEAITDAAKRLAPRANLVCHLKGVNTDLYRPGERPNDRLEIVCSRGFQPVYDNEIVVQSLAALSELDFPWRMRFMAGGPGLEKARELLPTSVREHVEFIGGSTPAEVRDAFATSHVYVSMSQSDSTSMALLEALASGMFPVVSDIPANRPWVNGGDRPGTLVPLGDADALGEALKAAATNHAGWAQAQALHPEHIRTEAHSVTQMRALGDKLAAALAKQ